MNDNKQNHGETSAQVSTASMVETLSSAQASSEVSAQAPASSQGLHHTGPGIDPTLNFTRGPRVSVAKNTTRTKTTNLRKHLAQLAQSESVGLAVVGLNAAKVRSSYRITLVQESLSAALSFDPEALTAEDKERVFEVLLYGADVQDRLLEALEKRGLLDTCDLVCPDQPLILEGRLSRVPPHTPSLSVAWPADLRGPSADGVKVVVIPVMAVRVQPDNGVDALNIKLAE